MAETSDVVRALELVRVTSSFFADELDEGSSIWVGAGTGLSVREMQVVADRAISEFGHIDFLLANAGIASNSPIAEMSDQQWQEMIDVNLTGVFHSFRAVVPHMIERGFGRIVAAASIIARMGGKSSGH